MLLEEKTCFYCEIRYRSKENEHVFPEGLGGQRKMMDCVCPSCNSAFSSLENELISKSFIAFVRVAEASDATRKYVMGAVRTLRQDEALQVALEVEISSQLHEKLVAQIVLKEQKLHIRYEVKSEYDRLLKTLADWKENNNSFTIKTEIEQILCFQLTLNAREEIEQTAVPILPKSIGLELSKPDDAENIFLLPRIYQDSKSRLKIRARSKTEALELMRHLLKWNLQSAPATEEITSGIFEVSVKHSHSQIKVDRALAKIVLNALIFYYPDAKKERGKLLQLIHFILTGDGIINIIPTHHKIEYDLIEKSHNLIFYPSEDSLVIRLSLYNGAFAVIFLLPKLDTIVSKGPGRLLVYHQEKKNLFDDHTRL